MEERSDMLMKSLAVEMASNTISLMVIRQLLERTKPGFQSEFDELFEQKWTQNGPLIIKNRKDRTWRILTHRHDRLRKYVHFGSLLLETGKFPSYAHSIIRVYGAYVYGLVRAKKARSDSYGARRSWL
jgi:hypothetical protein